MKRINPVFKYFLTLGSMLRTNIRDYGMYIALGAIFITFSAMTNGNFLKPTNFTNLLNQTAYVSVLAVGMTLVIVTKQIDLSVGFLGAFLGAYVVVSVEVNDQSVLIAVLSALVITIFVGFVKGYFVAKVKIPAFVVTLAGMFIFKGLLMLKTNNRTIPTTNTFFNKIGVGYLTDNVVGTVDTLTAVVGFSLIALFILMGILKRRKNNRLGIPSEKIELFITKLIIMSTLIFFITWTLARFRGISYLLLITAVIVVIYHIFTTQTVLGRRIYAVGGNPEAAELSGISVEKILIIVFISMGILALFSGVMYASMLQNTSPNHGPFWELYAIAAAYIGGTSADGGVGKVVNAFIGSIVIMSLKNGMALAAVNSNIEPIVLGSVLLLAVVFDVYTRNVRGADMVGMHYAKIEFKEEYITAKEKFKETNIILHQTLKEERIEANKKYRELLSKEIPFFNKAKAELLQKYHMHKAEKNAKYKIELKREKELYKRSRKELKDKGYPNKEEFKDKLAKLKQEHKEKMVQLKHKISDKKADYKKAFSVEKTRFNQALKQLKETKFDKKIDFKKALYKLKKEHRENIDQLNKVVALAERDLKVEKYQYKKTKDKIKTEYLANVQSYKDSILALKENHITKVKELKDERDEYKLKLEQKKLEFNEFKQQLKMEKEFNSPKIIELEYDYTSALGDLNRIKDTIRSATEEDYLDKLEMFEY